MQQYFVDKQVNIDDIVELDDDVLYHLIKVLRKDNTYIFRICDSNHDIYLANLVDNKHAKINTKLDEYNELDNDITCILALIKNDKLELTIQKLVELGIKNIVLYEAQRSVVKIKDEKKLIRINKIIKEAAEQSHRNIIPNLYYVKKVKDLDKYLSDKNYICYESEKQIIDIESNTSITYIIGPEGGFSKEEYNAICELGFESISLGKRILRAETAAIYMTSVIVSKNQ